jgi:hypothetical protein
VVIEKFIASMEAYGTMECWNNGIIGLKNENFLHSCCPSISEHILPIFQFSSIPTGAKPQIWSFLKI